MATFLRKGQFYRKIESAPLVLMKHRRGLSTSQDYTAQEELINTYQRVARVVGGFWDQHNAAILQRVCIRGARERFPRLGKARYHLFVFHRDSCVTPGEDLGGLLTAAVRRGRVRETRATRKVNSQSGDAGEGSESNAAQLHVHASHFCIVRFYLEQKSLRWIVLQARPCSAKHPVRQSVRDAAVVPTFQHRGEDCNLPISPRTTYRTFVLHFSFGREDRVP